MMVEPARESSLPFRRPRDFHQAYHQTMGPPSTSPLQSRLRPLKGICQQARHCTLWVIRPRRTRAAREVSRVFLFRLGLSLTDRCMYTRRVLIQDHIKSAWKAQKHALRGCSLSKTGRSCSTPTTSRTTATNSLRTTRGRVSKTAMRI